MSLKADAIKRFQFIQMFTIILAYAPDYDSNALPDLTISLMDANLESEEKQIIAMASGLVFLLVVKSSYMQSEPFSSLEKHLSTLCVCFPIRALNTPRITREFHFPFPWFVT